MTFRELFHDKLRSKKAKNGTWTKSFTWRQVMEVFDEAAQEQGLDLLHDIPGCVQHGFCPGCVQEEMEGALRKMKEEIDDLRRAQARHPEPVDTGDNSPAAP